jgi:hypothetical protein
MLGSLLISCNTVSIDSQKSVWQHCTFKIFKIPNQTFIQIYRMKSVRLSWPSIVFLKLEYIIQKYKIYNNIVFSSHTITIVSITDSLFLTHSIGTICRNRRS